MLTEERGHLSTAEQVELLIQSLGEQSLSVRATALQVGLGLLLDPFWLLQLAC